MFTLQVLPIRTFSVKLSVASLTAPDSTSNETTWRRAGGARSAIAAVFALLFVGQPCGPGALARRVPVVAAMPAATRTASARTVIAPITKRRCEERGSMEPPSLDGRPRYRTLEGGRRKGITPSA